MIEIVNCGKQCCNLIQEVLRPHGGVVPDVEGPSVDEDGHRKLGRGVEPGREDCEGEAVLPAPGHQGLGTGAQAEETTLAALDGEWI